MLNISDPFLKILTIFIIYFQTPEAETHPGETDELRPEPSHLCPALLPHSPAPSQLVQLRLLE